MNSVGIKFKAKLESLAPQNPNYAIAAAIMYVADELDNINSQLEELNNNIKDIAAEALGRRANP
jgi:hypothetical protein